MTADDYIDNAINQLTEAMRLVTTKLYGIDTLPREVDALLSRTHVVMLLVQEALYRAARERLDTAVMIKALLGFSQDGPTLSRDEVLALAVMVDEWDREVPYQDSVIGPDSPEDQREAARQVRDKMVDLKNTLLAEGDAPDAGE